MWNWHDGQVYDGYDVFSCLIDIVRWNTADVFADPYNVRNTCKIFFLFWLFLTYEGVLSLKLCDATLSSLPNSFCGHGPKPRMCLIKRANCRIWKRMKCTITFAVVVQNEQGVK